MRMGDGQFQREVVGAQAGTGDGRPKRYPASGNPPREGTKTRREITTETRSGGREAAGPVPGGGILTGIDRMNRIQTGSSRRIALVRILFIPVISPPGSPCLRVSVVIRPVRFALSSFRAFAFSLPEPFRAHEDRGAVKTGVNSPRATMSRYCCSNGCSLRRVGPLRTSCPLSTRAG
jgi:hypothetical protein